MKYNLLGNTGLLVSEICFGTMTFGGSNGGIWTNIGKVQQDEVNSLMQTVVDSGINFIDTANIYSFGESEQLLGQSIIDLKLNRHDLVIATKVRGRMGEGANNVGLSRSNIFQSVDASLKRLQLDFIDVLYVHGTDLLTPIEETMRALNDIVLTGKVRYIAVCNWPAWMVMKALGIADKYGWNKFVGMQYYYSLASRDIEREVLPVALDQNLAMMPWSPLPVIMKKLVHDVTILISRLLTKIKPTILLMSLPRSVSNITLPLRRWRWLGFAYKKVLPVLLLAQKTLSNYAIILNRLILPYLPTI
jgi:aryl-alcohol dehydrogenase-like predicted oxidoreductase